MARGVALHLPLHRGPLGATLCASSSAPSASGMGYVIQALGQPGDLRPPDRHARLADAGADGLLLGARAAAFRVVGRLRRARRRPDAAGRSSAAASCLAALAGLAWLGQASIHPQMPILMGGATAVALLLRPARPRGWIAAAVAFAIPAPYILYSYLAFVGNPEVQRWTFHSKNALPPEIDQPALRDRAAAAARADGLAGRAAPAHPRGPVPRGLARPARGHPLSAEPGRRPAPPLPRRALPAARDPRRARACTRRSCRACAACEPARLIPFSYVAFAADRQRLPRPGAAGGGGHAAVLGDDGRVRRASTGLARSPPGASLRCPGSASTSLRTARTRSTSATTTRRSTT